jgi:cell division protein FtsQ
MRKVFQIFLCLFTAAYLVVVLGFTDAKRAERKCTDIKIVIPDDDLYRFVDDNDVERILAANNLKVKGVPVDKIKTRKIEEIFRKSSYVRKVDVFFTVDGIMTIRIKQRAPVVRILSSGGATYYIDKDGYILPASRKFSPYLLVASGNFNMGDQLRNTMHLGDVTDNDFYKPWFDILKLVDYINDDDFLKAQVVQVYLDSHGIFELIPRVGAHQIVIGDASDLESKFFKLDVLYKEGLNSEGWNKYKKIDLRFKNQIICTKR